MSEIVNASRQVGISDSGAYGFRHEKCVSPILEAKKAKPQAAGWAEVESCF